MHLFIRRLQSSWPGCMLVNVAGPLEPVPVAGATFARAGKQRPVGFPRRRGLGRLNTKARADHDFDIDNGAHGQLASSAMPEALLFFILPRHSFHTQKGSSDRYKSIS